MLVPFPSWGGAANRETGNQLKEEKHKTYLKTRNMVDGRLGEEKEGF